MTDPTTTARERLFALIASIPGSGSVDWCTEARALLDEIAASAVSLPPADQTPCTCFLINDGGVHAASCAKRVADQTALESLADTLYDALYAITPFAEQHFADEGEGLRNAVRAVLAQAAVLPATTEQTTVMPPPVLTEEGRLRARVQVLEEDAERDQGLSATGAQCLLRGHQTQIELGNAIVEGHRFALSVKLGLGTGAPWDAIHDRVADLSRMADETQPAETDDTIHACPGRWGGPDCRCFDAETTADKAAALGLADTEYRAQSHAAAISAVRAALPGMYAHVAFRLEDVLNGADETQPAETEHQPHRGDQFEAWLKAQRDAAADYPEAYQATDGLLDLYRLHADMGVPLGGHVCEAKVVGDCECLEQPVAGARQDGAES